MYSPLIVLPGKGVGPFLLGITREDAVGIATSLETSIESRVRWPGHEPSLIIAGQLQLHFEAGEVVEMEVAQPDRPGVVPVLFEDAPLLSEPAGLVLDRLRLKAIPDVDDPEFPATAAFPTMGIVLWMDAKPMDAAGRRYQAVGIFRPRPGARSGSEGQSTDRT